MRGAHDDSGLPPRKRCRRYNDRGHAHFLTFSCFQRQAFLSRDRTRQWLIKAVDRARLRHRFDVWGYVIMPEHVHLLIYPTCAEYSMSNILKSIKRSVTNRAVRYVREDAPWFLSHMTDHQPNGISNLRFWQRGGGYDRNLWEPAEVWEKLDYIHGNPVRRRLCGLPDDWLWSSARFYSGRGPSLLTITTEHLPHDPRRTS